MTEIQFVDLISTYHRILPSWLLRLSVPNQDWQGHAAWNSEETDAWHDSELPIEKLMSKSKSSGWLCFPRCKYTRIVKPSHLHRPSTAFITWDDNRWEGCISHLWQDPTLYHRMLPNSSCTFLCPTRIGRQTLLGAAKRQMLGVILSCPCRDLCSSHVGDTVFPHGANTHE